MSTFKVKIYYKTLSTRLKHPYKHETNTIFENLKNSKKIHVSEPYPGQTQSFKNIFTDRSDQDFEMLKQ